MEVSTGARGETLEVRERDLRRGDAVEEDAVFPQRCGEAVDVAVQIGRSAAPSHLRRWQRRRCDLASLSQHEDDRPRGGTRGEIDNRLDDGGIQLSVDTLHVDDARVVEALDEL